MKILMISTDKSIFNKNSSARERMIQYGSLAEELHIIVFSLRKKFAPEKIAKNIFLYPTNSLSRWFYFLDGFKISKKIIKEKERDFVVTCQDPFETGLAGFLIKRKFNIPLQIQVHTDFLSPYFYAESFLNKVRVRLSLFIILRANAVRAVSRRIRDSVNLKFKPRKINITNLPIFIDADKIKNTLISENLRAEYPQFKFIIIMASRLSREKNINLALRVMKRVLETYKDAGMVIFGSGSEKEILDAEIKKFNLSDNVKIRQAVEFEKLISYYKTADAFLLTSNYEGCGLAVLEAVISGLPVVMTDVGIANEILINKKDALIAPVGDEAVLAKSILNLIYDKALRETLVKNAKTVINFKESKEDYLKKYYESLVLAQKKYENHSS